MANIKDFQAAFGTKSVGTETRYPFVELSGWRFRLLSVKPYFGWHDSGEKKPDGSTKWAQDEEMTFDDSGERVRSVMQLQLIDADGRSTSASAPFEDNKRYFTLEEVQRLTALIGQEVKLNRPRIELRDQATKTKSGFNRIETKLVFVFDSVDFE